MTENKTNLINRSAVKQTALLYATELQKTTLTRVSADFTERANAALEAWIKEQISIHPTEGKTIR